MNNEYLPDIELELTVTNIPPYEPKKMDFGRIPVCSKCGNNLLQWSEKRGPCCDGGERITLRKYYKEVLNKEFDNDGWSWEDKTIYAVSDEFRKEMLDKDITIIKEITNE